MVGGHDGGVPPPSPDPAGRLDAVVVGGGPAGLSCALYLARYNRSVLVVDGREGRSAFGQHNRNYLGFPDGIGIDELLARGREQVQRYPGARIRRGRVVAAAGDADRGFALDLADGTRLTARTVVLATGVTDHFPRFPGWDGYVGRSLFWCITCDGYESRGRDVLVVGHTDAAAGEALQLHSLTDRVRLLTNADTHAIAPELCRRLAGMGMEVVTDRIAEVEGADGQLRAVRTAGGRRLPLEMMFSLQGATPATELAEALGVELNDAGFVAVDTEQKTSCPGVYAAGDVAALHAHQVTTAVHEGAQAANAANYFLYPAEVTAGVG